ncbi:MAG: hypothetical protein RMN24_01260 [Anaerolineae bacterium]|nr:hypothetical protein [Caldilineales bacterium]MDW8267766.1 hypothetical protein [Anaerolineae bacterium]
MSLLERLRRLLAPTPAADARSFRLEVRCRACGEVIPVRIDLANDLSLDYETGHWQVHKVVVGSGRTRCFRRIEVDLVFDARRQLLDSHVVGGELIIPS